MEASERAVSYLALEPLLHVGGPPTSRYVMLSGSWGAGKLKGGEDYLTQVFLTQNMKVFIPVNINFGKKIRLQCWTKSIFSGRQNDREHKIQYEHYLL